MSAKIATLEAMGGKIEAGIETEVIEVVAMTEGTKGTVGIEKCPDAMLAATTMTGHLDEIEIFSKAVAIADVAVAETTGVTVMSLQCKWEEARGTRVPAHRLRRKSPHPI